MGDRHNAPLRVDLVRQIKLEFNGSTVTSDAGPRQLFAAILGRIGRMRLACASG